MLRPTFSLLGKARETLRGIALGSEGVQANEIEVIVSPNIREEANKVVSAQPALEPIRIQVPEGLEELIPGYLAARKADVEKLWAAIGADDFNQVRILGHNIKGNGTSYGFTELSRLGAALEEAGKLSHRGESQKHVEAIASYLIRVEV